MGSRGVGAYLSKVIRNSRNIKANSCLLARYQPATTADVLCSDSFVAGCLSCRSGSLVDSVGSSQSVSLELRFINDLPATLFAGSRIEAEDKLPLTVALIDPRTNMRVTSGPLSSSKVLIVVLDGDFDSDSGEEWREEEFTSNIVREREGRRPLITGDPTINLQEGLASLFNITFTDNSSWIRSRRFRLGARISQKAPVHGRVKEAASRSFIVKDHRGAVHMKHHPPVLKDDVWRLEHIAKGGKFHSRLASQGIHKVEEFLRLLEANPSLLRFTVSPRISDRTWDAIVAHAVTCVVDDNPMFAYSQESTNAGLLLNSVYRVVRVTFDGGDSYLPTDELTPYQIAWMKDMKRQAYADVDQLVPVSWPLPPWPMNMISRQPDAFLAPQESPRIPLQGYCPVSDSTVYGSGSLESQQRVVSGSQRYQPDQIFGQTAADIFTTGNVCSEAFDGGISFPGSSEGPAVFNGHNVPKIHTSACIPSTSVWTTGNSFLYGSSGDQARECGAFPFLANFDLHVGSSKATSQSFGVHFPGANGRSRVAWCKVRAAFRFRSMKNVAARRRLSRPLCAV